MSEDEAGKTEETERPEDEAEPGPGETGTPGPEETRGDSGDSPPRGRGPALIALLLALVAAGLAGWAAWQTWRLEETRAVAGNRVGGLAERVDRLAGRVAELDASRGDAAEAARQAGDQAAQARRVAESAAADVDRIRGTTGDLGDEVAALQGRLADQADRVERLASRLDAREGGLPTRGLALAHAEYLVRTAYGIAELERDPRRAARALAMASDRLQSLSAPGLTRLRESLAAELEAFRAAPTVDREALAARLAGLAEQVPSLPLREDWGPGAFVRDPADSGGDETGDRGWWGATRDFLGEYFTVRRTGETGTALPDPATLRLTREVLRLELEQARLALLRGEQARYDQSLQRAGSLVERYFAPDAPAVRSLAESLASLAEKAIAPPVPEHGAALDTLVALRGRDSGGG